MGFPGSSVDKESACNVGDSGLIPGLGKSPGERHGNPLQYSCLENPHEQRNVVSSWGPKESDLTERLSLHRIHFVTKNLVKKLRKAYFEDNCIHAKIARYMLGGGGGLVAKLCLTLETP